MRSQRAPLTSRARAFVVVSSTVVGLSWSATVGAPAQVGLPVLPTTVPTFAPQPTTTVSPTTTTTTATPSPERSDDVAREEPVHEGTAAAPSPQQPNDTASPSEQSATAVGGPAAGVSDSPRGEATSPPGQAAPQGPAPFHTGGAPFLPGAHAEPLPPGGGDGIEPPAEAGSFPPHLRALSDSIARSGASNTDSLIEALAPLGEHGLSAQEAALVGFGRFPVAGKASYIHDWWFPRFGPGWRLHEGTDIFAERGTPVRAPADGTVRISQGGLGGLSVYVIQPDSTYYYLAHLAGIPPGLVEGTPVKTGQVVGFVGDSGNARGTPTHLHFEIHPGGGGPVDPKPLLDQFRVDALAAAPALIESYARGEGPQPPPASELAQQLQSTVNTTVQAQEPAARSEPLSLAASAGDQQPSGLLWAQSVVLYMAATYAWVRRAGASSRSRWLPDVVRLGGRSASTGAGGYDR